MCEGCQELKMRVVTERSTEERQSLGVTSL